MCGMVNSRLPESECINVIQNQGGDMRLGVETILRSWSVLEEEAVKRGDFCDADRIRECIFKLLEAVA